MDPHHQPLLCVLNRGCLNRLLSTGDRPGDFQFCPPLGVEVYDSSETLGSNPLAGIPGSWNVSGCTCPQELLDYHIPSSKGL